MWNILLQWSYSGGAVSNFLIYVWSYCKVKVIDVQCTVMYELSTISFVQRNNSKYQCVKEDKTRRSQMRKFQRCHVEFKFIRPKLLLLQPLCAY